MEQPTPRLRYADRQRIPERADSLEQLLPPEHPARAVLAFVQQLNVEPLLQAIRAVKGHAGAPAVDPEILVAVWLYATLDGISSSRELADLCRYHLAYRWLVGEVPLSHSTLAAFRTDHADVLDSWLTHSMACLLHDDLIALTPTAQDGLRVRAAAGSSSFHRAPTLDACLATAQEQVQALQRQADDDPGAVQRRVQARRQAAQADRVSRLQHALATMQQLQTDNAAKPPSQQDEPDRLRVSTTDPEARVMKMADGGFRPAYNVQLATTVQGGVIVGVSVTNEGTDMAQLPPMVQQIRDRLEQQPDTLLADGGFNSLAAIDTLAKQGVTVYAPVKAEKKQLQAGKDPYAPKRNDTPALAAWRARMATPAAKALYKYRAQTAEWVNAQLRNHGLYQVTVRGAAKVRTLVLWHALAHNFERWLAFGMV